jgi:predicted glycosyltransferase
MITVGRPADSGLRMDTQRRIWIDLDHSPHVPFFVSIVEEPRKYGHQVILTAPDAYQVRELLGLHHLSSKVVGEGTMGRIGPPKYWERVYAPL